MTEIRDILLQVNQLKKKYSEKVAVPVGADLIREMRQLHGQAILLQKQNIERVRTLTGDQLKTGQVQLSADASVIQVIHKCIQKIEKNMYGTDPLDTVSISKSVRNNMLIPPSSNPGNMTEKSNMLVLPSSNPGNLAERYVNYEELVKKSSNDTISLAIPPTSDNKERSSTWSTAKPANVPPPKMFGGEISSDSSSNSVSSNSSSSVSSQDGGYTERQLRNLETEQIMKLMSGGSTDEGIVRFWMPGCSHCERFAPIWQQFKLANVSIPIYSLQVSSPELSQLASLVGVEGYPTVVLFRGGQIIHYGGPRTVEDLTNFVQYY